MRAQRFLLLTVTLTAFASTALARENAPEGPPPLEFNPTSICEEALSAAGAQRVEGARRQAERAAREARRLQRHGDSAGAARAEGIERAARALLTAFVSLRRECREREAAQERYRAAERRLEAARAALSHSRTPPTQSESEQ